MKALVCLCALLKSGVQMVTLEITKCSPLLQHCQHCDWTMFSCYIVSDWWDHIRSESLTDCVKLTELHDSLHISKLDVTDQTSPNLVSPSLLSSSFESVILWLMTVCQSVSVFTTLVPSLAIHSGRFWMGGRPQKPQLFSPNRRRETKRKKRSWLQCRSVIFSRVCFL